MSKLIGKFVTEKLSGRQGIVVEKKKKNYMVRLWIHEQCNWVTMKCPKEQFEVGKIQEHKKIGY